MNAAPVIAVVDDDASVRQALGSLLRSLDMHVALYESGSQVLSAVDTQAMSCVVTDIQMPGMNGLSLCAALRERGLRMPVIFMTAFPEERYRQQAADLGAFCFLSKPFVEADIIRCIEAALEPEA
ncbi:response regulator transcription factor [Cupriavidus respiraculi]|uniref:Transcriptional regulatory protein TdiR n=1 Tax=Cupriavidus respiraculi TaxID=195930 RepID=A0ABM8WLM3_9BURK|nr:response regulator [Cupriavidus respiraculi]CAG9168117.1 Transcriptional regulatory protein TdiR [Cupriavidus respiraculi]